MDYSNFNGQVVMITGKVYISNLQWSYIIGITNDSKFQMQNVLVFNDVHPF